MLHLITVATHSERYLPVLEKQAEDKGINLVKLGMGKEYVGHYMKDLETMYFLRKINKDDIVIFVDGFDTLMLAEKDEIVKKFEKLDADLVLSVENVGFLSFIHSTVFERVKGKYINTGLFMGRAGFMLEFLEAIYKDDTYNRRSNQKTWCSYLFKLEREGKLDRIKMDSNSDIFLNHSMTTSNVLTLKNKRIEIDTGSKPAFIQGNGCTDMNYIINDTGYSAQNIHQDTFFRDKMKYNLKAVFKTYSPILTFYIYMIILLLVIGLYLGRSVYKNRLDTSVYF